MSPIEVLLYASLVGYMLHLAIGWQVYWDDMGRTHDPRDGERPEDMKFCHIFCWGFIIVWEIIKLIMRSDLFKTIIQAVINVNSIVIERIM